MKLVRAVITWRSVNGENFKTIVIATSEWEAIAFVELHTAHEKGSVKVAHICDAELPLMTFTAKLP